MRYRIITEPSGEPFAIPEGQTINPEDLLEFGSDNEVEAERVLTHLTNLWEHGFENIGAGS